MSRWTHAICVRCWDARNPDRPATGFGDHGERERCCFCGLDTYAGIYVRHDPNELDCEHS